MKKFKVVKVNNLEGGILLDSYYLTEEIEAIPSIREHYQIKNELFRCIEHHPGAMRVVKDNILLRLEEIC